MRYLHILMNSENLVTEMLYSNTPNKKLSMQVMEGQFTYKIFDRENETQIQ